MASEDWQLAPPYEVNASNALIVEHSKSSASRVTLLRLPPHPELLQYVALLAGSVTWEGDSNRSNNRHNLDTGWRTLFQALPHQCLG